MIAGLILIVVNLPGIWLVFLGILISSFANGFDEVSVSWNITFFFLALLTLLIDNLTLMIGAKKYGATKWGILGAIVGSVLGFILASFPGALLGPFFGAMVFEIVFAGKELRESIEAGFGAFIGIVVAVMLKAGIALAMILTWIWLINR